MQGDGEMVQYVAGGNARCRLFYWVGTAKQAPQFNTTTARARLFNVHG